VSGKCFFACLLTFYASRRKSLYLFLKKGASYSKMDTVKKSLSFSTMWNYMKSSNGAELLHQILDLGFQKVELNYRISKEMLATMEPLITAGRIAVSSIHNVFPRVDDPAFDTDSLLLGYADPGLRRAAVELTQQSVDYAQRLGAAAVVIHPGEVPISEVSHYDRKLKKLYQDGKKETPEYAKLFAEMLEYRSQRSPEHVELIRRSLTELCEYIGKKNYQVKLGIENRAMCHQIPDFTEAGQLLTTLAGLPVYFWYDIGHGLVLENLGLFNNMAGALGLADRTIGIHIHDAIGIEDHWAPYLHSDNLDRFLELIAKIPVKVLELGSKNSAAAVEKGVAVLCEKLQPYWT
jgi:sugar phosphate isomerase/epimerase